MPRVLIVDGHRETRRLLEAVLRTPARTIIEASCGDVALCRAKDENPDLVVLDLHLSGPLSGPQLIHHLKDLQETQDCPILVVSTMPLPQAYYEALQRADGFLAKPFRLRDLRQKIGQLLDEPVPDDLPALRENTAPMRQGTTQ